MNPIESCSLRRASLLKGDAVGIWHLGDGTTSPQEMVVDPIESLRKHALHGDVCIVEFSQNDLTILPFKVRVS